MRRTAAQTAPPTPHRSWWEGLTREQLHARTFDLNDPQVRDHVVRMSASEIGRNMVTRPTCSTFSLLPPAILDQRQRVYANRGAYSPVDVALVEGVEVE